MNIYKIALPDGYGTYDCFFGFVICAEDEETARYIASSNSADEGANIRLKESTPIHLIGKAAKGIHEQIILEDFNAG